MKGFIISLVFVAVFSFASTVSAQGLVPCGTDGDMCEACDLLVLANNVLQFLIVIAVLISGIVFAIGGFHWVTSAGSSGKIDKGKALMTNAVIGVIITLAAWLIVDTILTMLAGGSLLDVWDEIQCN